MAKEELIEMRGKVHEILPDMRYRVTLDNGHELIAYVGGKMRKHKIRILAGDNVTLELSAYDLIAGFGTVQSAKVMMDRETGRSKGFGFVEMGSPAEAQAAIEGLHGQSFGGRDLTVNIARPMESRPPRSGGGDFGGRRGGY